MTQAKILWIYRRTGRGGTEEGEHQLSALLSSGWYIVGTSTCMTKDGTPVLCVVLQNDSG